MKKELYITIGIIFTSLLFYLFTFLINRFLLHDKLNLSPVLIGISIKEIFKPEKKPAYIVYGYLPYWSLEDAKYIQQDKLTDIAYFGINLKQTGGFVKILDDGSFEPGYNAWRNSKTLTNLINDSKWHNTRFALTVIAHENDVIESFLNCQKCWTTFKTDLISELRFRNISDVNLNFEYVGDVDKQLSDKFTQFVRFLNYNLDQEMDESFVVASAFADSMVRPRISNVVDLSKVADGVFVMAYDFHRPDSDTAGPVAPIQGKGVYSEYDIKTMLDDILVSSFSDKIILGVPYYGYNWVVSPADGKYAERIPGDDTIGYSQSQTYAKVLETINENRADVLWDDLAKTPYFTYISEKTGSTRQVYFDNVESLKVKYQLVKNLNLGGIGIWALGYDEDKLELWNLIKSEFIDMSR